MDSAPITLTEPLHTDEGYYMVSITTEKSRVTVTATTPEAASNCAQEIMAALETKDKE